jgi:protein-tyrosine phosphatase
MTWPAGRQRDGGIDEVPLPDGAAGRLWLCGKHAIGPDVEATLAAVGASVVVCLNERAELADRYPGYVAWLDAHRGGRAVWHPIPDLHAPPVEEATELVSRLRAHLDAGEGLLLHCGAGIGRAGTVAAALLLGYGLPLDAALSTVRASRPTAGPEAGAQADLLATLARRPR